MFVLDYQHFRICIENYYYFKVLNYEIIRKLQTPLLLYTSNLFPINNGKQ